MDSLFGQDGLGFNHHVGSVNKPAFFSNRLLIKAELRDFYAVGNILCQNWHAAFGALLV